jgi:L-ascorbate metabolism protein UlaG (beta-lactamase superfamily)
MLKFLKFLLVGILTLSITIFLFMQQRSFGRLPKEGRLERVKRSPHYQNNQFKNLVETPTLADDASYVGMTMEFLSKGTNREPLKSLPSIRTDLKNLDRNQPVIIWFGHSTFLIHINGKNILVDPIFSERPSPVQYVGSKSYPGTRVYNVDDLPNIDVVIISHDHYDHLDYNTITALKDKTNLFCVPLGVSEHLLLWGIDESRVAEFDWWDSKTILEGFELTATPARHFSGRGFSRDKTLWSSYALMTPEHRIFIGGDSGYDASFKKIGEKFGPFDIVMLECGQYDKQWPFVHMMPEETVQASIDLQAKLLLPVHWAKFTLALHPWNEPVERALVQAKNLNMPVTTPKIGEPILLGSGYPTGKWWQQK